MFRLIALVALVLLPSMSEAQGRRNRGGSTATVHWAPGHYAGKDSSPVDALAEVNAARAKYGLKPFLADAGLTKAANAAARQRADRGIHGHLPESDFSYVPSGTVARAAGAGALEPSWGWGSCCTYDQYTYAGAAWVMGKDGRRYMHLFVR